ncbi:MAG: PQQ-dependent sugar dehydrogenase [Steroidobacteraceae bacterium]
MSSLLLQAHAESPPQRTAAKIYSTTCAACHGTRLQGTQGPSLLASKYIHGTEDENVAHSIRQGYPEKGMPGWSGLLSEDDIQNLVSFIKTQRFENSPEHLAELDEQQKHKILTGVFNSELHDFHLEILAETAKPFGLAFLPDGRLLVTEDQGGLRVIENGRLVPEPVKGTPHGKPQDPFKRALMDVAVHPDYKHNGWIYLVCGDLAHDADGKGFTEITVLRGHLRDNAWVDAETLLRLPLNTDTGRLVFDGKGYMYLTTASEAGINAASGSEPYTQEQLLKTPPQDLKSPLGKILRFHDDGRIPADNPFAGTPGAMGAIWSYGHRNPQGLAFDPSTGWLWSTEHGPRGGDELNLIRRGHNYGWPVISYGTRYDGLAFTTEIKHEGMEQPVINWTPSIGVSHIAFYEGKEFPKWKHNLFIGSLIQEELFRVVLDGEQVKVRELLFKDLGRVRAITAGPEGDLYLALELRTKGLIVRMVPGKKSTR